MSASERHYSDPDPVVIPHIVGLRAYCPLYIMQNLPANITQKQLDDFIKMVSYMKHEEDHIAWCTKNCSPCKSDAHAERCPPVDKPVVNKGNNLVKALVGSLSEKQERERVKLQKAQVLRQILDADKEELDHECEGQGCQRCS